MKLTSADVAEVIQKRLLTKNETGVRLLSDIYHTQSNNFKTLFDFADGAATYRNYKDRDHFIHSYPFIPYQFTLFQSAIQNLSLHNAFEGKHSSVGERSMLGVFQQVAINIANHEIGQLATFDLMFEGIRTALKSNIQRAIIQAENNLNNPFAIRVLKSLFLVKYVKEFKATPRNLCVLMLDGFSQDIPGLRKKVEEALNLLEHETYVQRSGEIYEYLTDEEKDVEDEIKSTEIDAHDVAEDLEKIIFDSIVKHRKIRYDENGQDYPFSKKLDERLYGRDYELSIHIISPFHEHAENEQMLRTSSTYNTDELFVLMPPDARLLHDILMYKRTEKYIRQNVSTTQQDAVKRILESKSHQNRELYVDLQRRVQALLGKSKLLVAGADLDLGTEDAQTRIITGFHELISRAYPNLRMLRGVNYTEEMIKTILNDRNGTLLGTDSTSLAESEQELLAYIQSNSRGGVRTTLKSLLERFERKPYGWYYAAILCTLAHLCTRGKIEVRSDSNLLEDEDLERALRNTHGHGNIVLEPQVEFTASQVRALKEFYEDFFDAPPQTGEAKALGKEAGTALQELANQLTLLGAQSSQYPFLNALNPVLEQLGELTGKPYTWYLTEFAHMEDTLLHMKEDVIDPIRKFMSGPQKGIYDNARSFMQTQEANFVYLDTNEAAQLVSNLADPACFKGNRMQQVKSQLEDLQARVTAQINAEISQAKSSVAALMDRLCGMPEFSVLSQTQQEQLTKAFNNFNNTIEQQHLIAVIRDTLRRFEDTDYQRLLSQMTSWAQPAPTPESALETDGTATPAVGTIPTPPAKPEPRIEYVPSRAVKVSFDKAWLADESDVERYLESMREALLDEIRKGKRIQI